MINRGLSTPPPAPVLEQPPLQAVRPVLPPGRQIKNPQVADAVAAARDVRKKGDMVNALEALKQADLHEPDHPEILSELAITYEELGLTEKAQAMWHKVMAMGEAGAGGYYVLARSRLNGGISPGPEETAALDDKPLALGVCDLTPDAAYLKGEKVTLRIPIRAAPGQKIRTKGINADVFFFDQVSNGSVELSKGEKPPYRWLSTNWTSAKGGLVEVDCILPVQNAAFAQGGLRRHYGWMVRLYYENKLMGQQASSDDLLNLSPQGPAPAGADNALFPRN